MEELKEQEKAQIDKSISENEFRESKDKDKDIPIEKMNKEQLVDRIKQMSEEIKKYFDLYLRSQAEIENLKKRFQREREDFIKFANEALIKELLSVIDNLERALVHSEEQDQSPDSLKALKEGVGLTLKGMKDILKKVGLEEFESLGKKFDPNYHYAVDHKPDSSVEPGIVVQELQKGYILNGKLIRPAMVVVSKKEEKKQD